MKNNYLLPQWCRPLGILLTLPGLVLGYVYSMYNYEIPHFGFNMREKDTLFLSKYENFTNELAILLVVIGLTFMAFAKNKKEDELTSKIRLNALYWSMLTYYSAYFICLLVFLIFDDIPFISDHAYELSIVTPLLIFNLRLYYLQYAGRGQFLIADPRFIPHFPFRITGILFTLAGASCLIYELITEGDLSANNTWSASCFFIFFSGLLLWAFSKHKTEDEMMIQQRMESLQVAFYFNYLIFLIATLFIYSFSYLLVLLFGQFSLLVYFIIRMEYVRYRNQKITDTFEGGIES
ncbi:hypothetical protein D9M68_559910 [compost metagenome]